MICERCASPAADGTLMLLMDGWRAHLCPACLNAWCVFMKGSQHYDDLMVTQDRLRHSLARAADESQEVAYLKLREEERALLVYLFNEGGRWVSEKIGYALDIENKEQEAKDEIDGHNKSDPHLEYGFRRQVRLCNSLGEAQLIEMVRGELA